MYNNIVVKQSYKRNYKKSFIKTFLFIFGVAYIKLSWKLLILDQILRRKEIYLLSFLISAFPMLVIDGPIERFIYRQLNVSLIIFTVFDIFTYLP